MFEVRYQRDAAQADNAEEWMFRVECATCYDAFIVDADTNMIEASVSDAPPGSPLADTVGFFIGMLNDEREQRKRCERKMAVLEDELLELGEYL